VNEALMFYSTFPRMSVLPNIFGRSGWYLVREQRAGILSSGIVLKKVSFQNKDMKAYFILEKN
jgi:hypothetical protein